MMPLWDRALRFGQRMSSNQAEQPVGVLDIGSNSVRLVIYERLSRSLTPLYNEKSSCTLGRGVAETGRIADENASLAFSAFERFARVIKSMNVADLHIIATSAVRESDNGPAFMKKLAEIIGQPGRVLSGEEEAHFAALGVVSGMPEFAGLVGDLGGGSLELAAIHNGIDTIGETLTLGAIRLQDDSGQNPSKALKLARRVVGEAKTIDSAFAVGGSRDFAAIGGTWRALAKVLQRKHDYPLHMVQGYRVDSEDLLKLCLSIVDEDLSEKLMNEVGNSRRALLPYGAAAMIAVLEKGAFDSVTFSALGVREGYLYSLLDDKQRLIDPLLDAVMQFNAIRARTPDFADEIIDFTGKIVDAAQFLETPKDTVLRKAACYLSDIGWRGHPDYRGEQSVGLVAYSAMAGIAHSDRAFLGETLAVRYMGLKHESENQKLMELLDEQGIERARAIGAMLRLAYTASSAIEGVLPKIDVTRVDDGVVFEFPTDGRLFDTQRMETKAKHLAATLDMPVSFELV